MSCPHGHTGPCAPCALGAVPDRWRPKTPPPPLELKGCDNPECRRTTTCTVAFCCDPCRQAREGHYEIHESGPYAHTPGCHARQVDRGALSGATLFEPGSLVEVELLSTLPTAIAAVRHTIEMLQGGRLEERDGKYFVPDGFVAWAVARQGYVRKVVRP